MKKLSYIVPFLLLILLGISPAKAQVYTMGATGGTITDCGGTIENPGGFGAYVDGLDVTQTICSGTGQCVQLSFASFGTEACCDNLTIYDGNSNLAAVLGIYAGATNPGTVTTTGASGGCVTLQFHSDGSITNTGFSASISCVTCPPAITLGQGGASISGCSGIVMDAGGPGNYSNNENITQTFCSDVVGQCVSLTFTSFNTEADADILSVYDGPTTADGLIGQFSGTTIPPSISTSTNSGGCMTLSFNSNASITSVGFQANLSCGVCQIPDLILGQGGNTINTCGGTLVDPGASGNYSNNQSITQTICSGAANQCVALSFTSFNTEATFDRLSVYDGPNTSADLLGVFSGFNVPMPVASSTNSGGCLTLVFSTNGSVTSTGFSATISCGTCQAPVILPTGFCDDAQPFCTDVAGGITFPAATGTQSEFGGGISCLGSTPNPAWYFMKVEDTGPIDLQITSGFDVDFICWGPFSQTQWNNGVCTQVLDPVWAANATNVIDCSYSGSATENCNIPNAVTGEYYVLLLTNFSNQATNINFQQNGGAGSTDCSIFCSVDATPAPTACDPATNTYILAGTIDFVNPPSTGTLTITNSSGGYMSFNAPFATSVNYNFTNLSSNGNAEQLTVVFSDDNTCAAIADYTAPASCSQCPVQASVSGPACEGQSLSLAASNVANGQYSWIGPNGFTSTDQNPVLTNVTPAMAGVYQVTALNPMNNCSSISSVNVFVFPTPATPTLTNDGPVCEGTPINFTCNNYPGGTFSWTGPNSFTSTQQNPTIAAASAAATGNYSCTVTVNTCPSLPATIAATINPYPSTPVPSNNSPLCDGDNLQLTSVAVAGATYEWKNPAGTVISSNQNQTLNAVTSIQSGVYSLRVQVNGCWSLPGTTTVNIYPIPTTPVLVSNSPVCENALLTINGPAPLPIVGTTYAWTGPSAFSASTQNISVASSQLTNAGQYSLVITENGCSSAAGTTNVVVIALPISNAGADLTVCSLEPASIGAPPVAGYTYSWLPIGGLDFSTIANPTAGISNMSGQPNNFTYIVTTSDQMCSTKDTVVITVNPQPIASFVSPNPACFEGNSFDFDADGYYSSSASFDWEFGPWASAPTSTLESPQDISFNSTGLQIVRLTITDRGCESNLYQAPVMVYKMPVSNFTSDYFVGCDPKVINFTNLSESDDPIKTYVWNFGNGRNSSLSSNPTILYNDPGVYDVSLVVTSEKNCADTFLINDMIRIYPSPVSDFALSPEVVYITQPDMDFNDLSQGADEVFYVVDDTDYVYQTNAHYTFPDSGIYDVRQVVTTAFGCRDSVTKQAVVELGYKIYVPTAFTPNDDGYNDRFQCYGEDVSEFSMMIYNRWGQLLYSSYDMDNGWDGRTLLKDRVCDGGVYVYKIAAVQRSGLKTNYEGTVVLLR
jgi:gliding motility-associated-like protein